MSLQDDVWDCEASLKGTADQEAYDRVITRLWEYEKHNDELREANNTFYKAFKLIQPKCSCDLAKLHSTGTNYCWKCGGKIKEANDAQQN